MTTAIYPGSFDPVTGGHEDLIQRSLHFVDRLIVGVANNRSKRHAFTLEERVALLKTVVGRMPGVEVRSFDGLLADFANAVGAQLVVRGLRAVSDFEYEFQMALMNRTLHPDLETVFLVPAQHLTFLSSSLVREVARYGGDVSSFVAPPVAEELRKKFGALVSVTLSTVAPGNSGAGWSCPRSGIPGCRKRSRPSSGIRWPGS